MFCSQCGKRVLESMLFCPFCGAPIVIPEQSDGAGSGVRARAPEALGTGDAPRRAARGA